MKKERFRRFIGILVSIIVVLAFFLFPDLLDFPSRLFSIFQGDFMFGLFWGLPVLYFGLLLYWTFCKSQVWEERTKFAKFLFGLRWSLLALYVLSLAGFYLAQLILEAKGLM